MSNKKTIWLTNCHLCAGDRQVVTGMDSSSRLRSECTECGHVWTSYKDYVAEYKSANGDLGPFPSEVTVPMVAVGVDVEYPGSEAFKSDIEDLIELAVEKAVAFALLDAYDRMEYDVREISLAGGELPLSRIYNNVVAKRDQAREEYNRRYGNDV